jgi:hypothetical protein
MISIFKERRGSWVVDSVPFYLLFAIVVGMLFLLFAFIVNSSAAGKHAIPPGLENFLIEQRFSTSCFNARDKFTDETLPVIEKERFDAIKLTRCFQISSKDVLAYRLKLGAQGEAVVSTSSFDETRGASGARVQPVRVLADGDVVEGTLRVEVQHAG